MTKLIKIDKSDNDVKDYYYMILPNELTVIVVVDNLSTMCGALLNVGVGSTNDPKPYDGMAHFLEHMLFLGSKNYENINFKESINKNGGITNASTGDTDTTYYFSIDCHKFIENLNMLADFLTNPLLKAENVDKERNAVNSESIKNLLDDNWIFNEMIKKIMIDTYSFNHYTCGNLDTLNGENLHLKVREFFETYYSSNIMHLIVNITNNIDLDMLSDNILNSFSKIPNKNLNKQHIYGDLLIPNRVVKYIPNTDIDSLTICFQIKKNFVNLIDTPFHLLDWILSSKSKYSIFKILEKLGLVIDIDIGQIFSFDDNILYIVKFILTKKGIDNTDKILDTFYNYIKSLQKYDGIKEIYNDVIKSYRRDFILATSENVIDTLEHLNFVLTNDVKPESIKTFQNMKPKYEFIKHKIIELLDQINIHNSSIIISSPDFNHKDFIIDKIYNVKYILDTNNLSYDKKLFDKLIKSNKFISDNINILAGDDYYPNKKPETIILDNFNFVYNFNSSFKNPEVHFYISLIIPDIMKDASTYIKTQLYLDTIYSNHNGVIDELTKAGYGFVMTLNNDNLIIYLKTDNNNSDFIIDNIIKSIFSHNNKEKGFNSVKEKIYKKYNSFYKEQPIKKINVRINKLLLNKYYTPYEMKDFILNSTYDECKNLFFDIIKKCNTTIVVSGNIYKENALKYANILYYYLPIKNKIEIDINDTRLQKLEYPYIPKCINYNKDEKNTIFTLSYILFSLKKSDPTFYDNVAFLQLLDSILDIRYFIELRTKKQFGYIVHTKISYIGSEYIKTGCIQFRIQSPVQTSDYLLQETIKFIKDELLLIKEFNDEKFNEYKNGVISSLKNKYNNLSELDIYLCSNIFDFSYTYDYKEQLIKSINNFTLEKFIKLYEEKLINNQEYFSISIDACRKK